MTEQEPIGVVEGTLKFRRPMNIELDMASAHSELIKDRVELIGIEIREGRCIRPRIETVVRPDPICIRKRNLKIELALRPQGLANPALIEIIDPVGPRSPSPGEAAQEQAQRQDGQSLKQLIHQSDFLSGGGPPPGGPPG